MAISGQCVPKSGSVIHLFPRTIDAYCLIMNVVSKLITGIIALGIGGWLLELYGRPDSDGILLVVFGVPVGRTGSMLWVAVLVFWLLRLFEHTDPRPPK